MPAGNRWFARLAVTELLHDALDGLEPDRPAADFDIAVERVRLVDR